MLTSISIQNYALIDQLSIDFSDGLSIITGETGAGKSILLGALGLVLGKRADVSTLKDSTKKCIVEVTFSIKNYNLVDFFETSDLDFEENTILRREILPSGKSRAFVNDTPVRLSVLTALKEKLIDIHSQHQTLQLSDANFQFEVLDALAKNQQKISSYKRGLLQYNLLQKELKELQQEQREANQQYDYNVHLFNELVAANLQADEQEILEEKLEKLSNVEEIKNNIAAALQVASADEIGLLNLLHQLETNLQKIAPFSKEYAALSERITSIKIELDDIIAELETANEQISSNPNELEITTDRLQIIYNLQKKHYVHSIAEILAIQEQLSEKVSQVENADEIINKKEVEILEVSKKLDSVALLISTARKKVISELQVALERLLSDLGMKNARFLIKISPTNSYFPKGKDTLSFLFAANKGGDFGELKKVASGGELSRIMLVIKKILSENTQLPTIIFDEIDTGVSGEIANKIATIMQKMSKCMQVISITHLPQIAAKGKNHYKVFKEDKGAKTTTNLKKLTQDERIVEIAEMLSGKNISDTAITHAKELLN